MPHLTDAAYSGPDMQKVALSGFNTMIASGVEVSLSPPVSVEVPATSVAGLYLRSGMAQPFSFLAVHSGGLRPRQKRSEAQCPGLSGSRQRTNCIREANDGNFRRF